MPIYEYQCEGCGHHLEALQKLNDPPLKKCPDCGRPRLKRLLSAPMFLLKGSGWYETDFKSEKEGRKNLADRPEKEEKKEEKPEAKTETKAETTAADASKPEAKAGAKADAKADAKVDVAKPKPARTGRPARKAAARRTKGGRR